MFSPGATGTGSRGLPQPSSGARYRAKLGTFSLADLWRSSCLILMTGRPWSWLMVEHDTGPYGEGSRCVDCIPMTELETVCRTCGESWTPDHAAYVRGTWRTCPSCRDRAARSP